MATYKIIMEIELPEEIAGRMDMEWSGLESDRVLIDGSEHNEGYLQALINDCNPIPEGLEMLHEIIGRKYNVELVPTEFYELELIAKPTGEKL